ncbi:replication-associated recombination protein A [Galactobacter sp.]|uniref:replication-associated recombination protein A n=1 Tax=Galactobacter sp. TaxID=2676125 RepID=UPI0025C3D645|nr:replication-associated recombination protein A [Galactobacter sp.]
MSDLFNQDSDEDTYTGFDSTSPGGGTGRSRGRAPLAVRMRPTSLDEVAGQQHLLLPGSPLRQLAEAEGSGPAGLSSVILWGPPGTGKTTLAHVIARGPHRRFVELSAISAGVKDVRRVMDQALEDRDLRGVTTVLFLDEIHRFNKAQQDALLPGVENGWVVLVAATTENPSFSVVAPLLSRSILLTLKSLTDRDLVNLLTRAIESERGLNASVEPQEGVLEHLVTLSGGDARKALTGLEAAAAVALDRHARERDDGATRDVEHDADSVPGDDADDGGNDANDEADKSKATITTDDAERAMDVAVRRYDKQGDNHYDTASALIKSIRGSDVDAAMHYMATMIEAGEDPRFIARRLVISAAEDIGMADPTALQTAVAAAQAVQLIGMPEGRIVLAEAVTHLATAPKSNASYNAINAAIADVRAGKGKGIPAHLRDAHYKGAEQLGHGKNYVYAHDAPHSVATQQYPPDDLVGVDYYVPTENGHERGIKATLATLRDIVRGRRRS